jgi:DNA-directed RNA polymerase subunit RPC12/RpoP
MLPMKCPKCSSTSLRVPITNNQLDDQVMRRRQCGDCGHRWFTVELAVPDYAVGWSAAHKSKPVLRAPVELKAGHVEAKDRLAALREANARREAKAVGRYGM